MDDIAIKVDNVSKTFKLPYEKNSTIKGAIINFRRKKKGYKKQVALKNISFEVKKGEFFGIVGRNGSGKSTLLKLISGIYAPDSGAIYVNGKLTPFIELGVGFNPELSGRDNVYLNGALLGFNRKEMEDMYDEIVAFAELEKFMDQKLKNYSSGMQVRLAFSIAIRANTDILVLDEVLAVGDAAFQKKCFDYFEELKKAEITVVLVTHDMNSVERFCDRAILLEYGDLKLIDKPKNIAKQYMLDNLDSGGVSGSSKTSNHNMQLSENIDLLDVELISKKVLTKTDTLEFEVSYLLNKSLNVELGISISTEGRSIIEHNTKGLNIKSVAGTVHRLRYKYDLDIINPGIYEISVAIFKRKGFKLLGYNTDSCNFILDGKKRGGIISKRGEWSIRDDG